MKTKLFSAIRMSSFLFLYLTFFHFHASAVSVGIVEKVQKSNEDCVLELYAPLSIDEVANLNRQEIEQKCKRKFTLKERLDLQIVKRSIKRNEFQSGDLSVCYEIERRLKKGFLLAVAGVVLFRSIGLIFSVISIFNSIIAKRKIDKAPDCPEKQKNLKRYKTNLLISISTIAIAALLLAILIQSGGF